MRVRAGWMVTVVGLCLLGEAVIAEPPATQSAVALSPAAQQAIDEVSSADASSRQQGLNKLQQVLGEQMKALTASDDPEAQARVVRLLQFQDGLTSWVLETMKLPEDQAKAQLAFCLRDDVLPKIGGLFQRESENRLAGLTALANEKDPAAGEMLLRYMEDRDRNIRLAAVDSLKGRPATTLMIDALWNVAVVAELDTNNSPLAVHPTGPNQPYRGVDDKLTTQACDVLLSLKSPELDAKVVGVFQKAQDYYGKANWGKGGAPWVMYDFQPPLRNACRLLKAYKPKAAYPVLVQLATGKAYQEGNLALNDKGQVVTPMMAKKQREADPEAAAAEDARIKKDTKETYFWSTRTAFIALIVETTGQKMEDYQLKRLKNFGNMWTVPTKADEAKAADKIKEWWAAHAAEYGAAATAPAAQDANSGK